MPKKIAINTRLVPRSGCRYTRTTAGASKARPSNIVTGDPIDARRSAKNFARTMIMRTFATSLN